MMAITRDDRVETPEEFAAIAHLRGWCHDMNECPICRAYRRGQEDERKR